MHSTKFRFTMHLCYRHKSEYLVCFALTSSSIIILLSSLMEQITGTLTQDTNFNLLYLPCSKICTLSFPLTYVMFALPEELNFNVYAILCSCVTRALTNWAGRLYGFFNSATYHVGARNSCYRRSYCLLML